MLPPVAAHDDTTTERRNAIVRIEKRVMAAVTEEIDFGRNKMCLAVLK
jgi:hypothetical protein